jgi:type IV pilus assembly protein PilX
MCKQSQLYKKATDRLKNEDGIVVVAALLILVLLTIMGISANRISNTEIQISGNELIYQQHLYRAEGATMEAVERLEISADPKTAGLTWLDTVPDSVTQDEIQNWQFGGSPSPAFAVIDEPGLADVDYIAVSEGIAAGSSLDIGSSKVHQYTIYGRSAQPNRGTTVVQVGFLKAF